MTLIISVIAPRFALQASDRRLTTLNADGTYAGTTDKINKAIFVGDRDAYAYTGIASIDGDTAAFFQLQIARLAGAGMPLRDAVAEAAVMTADQLRALPPGIDRHHAYVGVGWNDNDEPMERLPHISCWSNAVDESGHWLGTPRDTFSEYRLELPEFGDRFALFSAGVEVDSATVAALHARIAFQLTQSDEPAPVAEMLIETIREVHRGNVMVGDGVMVLGIPRALGDPYGPFMVVSGLPKLDVRTFTYAPDSEGFDGTYHGPMMVSADGGAVSDFQARGVSWAPDAPASGMSLGGPPRPRSAIGQRIVLSPLSRNDPCWCDSGKKYKKCHGR